MPRATKKGGGGWRCGGLRVFLKARELEPTCDRVGTPHYNMRFSRAPLPAAKLAAWGAPRTNAALFLPHPNPFIPDSLELQVRVPPRDVEERGGEGRGGGWDVID